MRAGIAGLIGAAAIAVAVGACGSSTTSSTGSGAGGGSGSGGSTVKTTSISGATVLTNSAGFTLYWFVPDTSTTSNCNGQCAQFWPPVKGPVSPGSGVTGTFGTITRSDGSTQATWNGHPLYTYVSDKSPGQATGNGLNISGGVWHEVTLSGTPAPASSAGGGGYGY